MRSLKLLGIAAPDPPGTETNPVPKRWIDWYASGMWRAMGCPSGTIDWTARRAAWPRRSPNMRWPRRSAITSATRIRSSCSISGSDRIGTVLFAATLVVSIATLVGLALGADFCEPLRQLVHPGVGGLSGARHGRIRNPLPGRLRRRCAALARHREHAAPDRARAAQGRAACRARRTLPSKPRGSCSPTSTSGGWSTSSATCRSASRPSPQRQRQPPLVVRAQIDHEADDRNGIIAATSSAGRSLNQSATLRSRTATKPRVTAQPCQLIGIPEP